MSGLLTTRDNLLSLIHSLPVGVIILDQSGKICFINTLTNAMFGYEDHELVGQPIELLIPERYHHKHHQEVAHFFKTPTVRSMSTGRVLPALTKNKTEFNIEIGLSPISFEGKQYVMASVLNTRNDILRINTYNDELTGLPNRALYAELSAGLYHLAIRQKCSLTVMFIDLDGFKTVNDTLGHDMGDKVLCAVSHIIRKSTRKNDVPARLGGDEFIITFYDMKTRNDALFMADHLIKGIENITRIDDKPIQLSASIGIAMTHRPKLTQMDTLTTKADELMYQAKHAGKGRCVFKEC